MNMKNTDTNILIKTPRIFRNEVIGFDYLFDFDIEIFISINGEIQDYSGCSFKKAQNLINQ